MSSKKAHHQAYQNKEKFRHNPNSKLTRQIYNIVHHNLCNRCDKQILWRKDYRKYKPLKEMRRCVKCNQVAVNRAYHSICNDCARQHGICAKCLNPCDAANLSAVVTQQDLEQRLQHAELKERNKRTIVRSWERGWLSNEDAMTVIDLFLNNIAFDWNDYLHKDEQDSDDDDDENILDDSDDEDHDHHQHQHDTAHASTAKETSCTTGCCPSNDIRRGPTFEEAKIKFEAKQTQSSISTIKQLQSDISELKITEENPTQTDAISNPTEEEVPKQKKTIIIKKKVIVAKKPGGNIPAPKSEHTIRRSGLKSTVK